MLDIDQIADHSWHHAMRFIDTPIQVQTIPQGTAVYVYDVLPNALPGGARMTVNISFALDGETVGHFYRTPDFSSEILYHQLVYANTTLFDSLYTLVMSASGSGASLIFFDYLLYATEAQGSPSATPTSTAVTPDISTSAFSSAYHPLATAVVGVALLVVGPALVLIVSCHLRRCWRRHHQACSPAEGESEFVCADATTCTPSTATPESESPMRSLSVDPLSNAVTVADKTPPYVALAFSETHPLPMDLAFLYAGASLGSAAASTSNPSNALSSPSAKLNAGKGFERAG